MEEEKAAKVER
jgi:kinesin family protein 2/24